MTTYVELRLMEALYGPERAAMLEVLAGRNLRDEITRLGGAGAPDTILHIDLAGRNPDDGMTEIPYEKGAALLRLLEQKTGRTRFDAYLRSYFDRHSFRPITTAEFLADLRTHLLTGDAALERDLKLDEWLYKPGLPDNAPVARSTALEAVEQHARAFAGGAPASSINPAATKWIRRMANIPLVVPEKLSASQSRTSIARRAERAAQPDCFFMAAHAAPPYQTAMPALDRFLPLRGRKFCAAYEDLMRPMGQSGR